MITLYKFTICILKNDTMPNKKYKIAVIQLNLNDVAENNLKKKCLMRDAANQAEVIPTRII
jgi:N-carbamoylputrescine amidase